MLILRRMSPNHPLSLNQFCDAYKRHIHVKIEEFRRVLEGTSTDVPLFPYEEWEKCMFDFFTEEPETGPDPEEEVVEEVVVGEELEA